MQIRQRWASGLHRPRTIQKQNYPYDEYKLFFVSQPHPKEAWKTVVWESQQPYAFVHHNCCDVTYEVLRAYGCAQVLDPAKEFVPNDWYDALPGTSYPIAEVPVTLHKRPQRQTTAREVPLVIPLRMKGLPPPHDIVYWHTWEELTLVWEMMIGHLLTLWASGLTFIAHAWHRHAPRRER